MLMVVRMVNVVNEQGTYWVANNFIWGWLLLPVTQLAELIKRDCATDKQAVQNKTLGYIAITAIICVLWAVTIPAWKPFMTNLLGFDEVDKLFNLVMVLLGFYVLYAFQSIFDATFYGLGKTNLMFFESIVTNSVYYGGAFILYVTGVWMPTLTGIALLFGIGVAFDSVVSLCAYIYISSKSAKSIFCAWERGLQIEKKPDRRTCGQASFQLSLPMIKSVLQSNSSANLTILSTVGARLPFFQS